MKRKNVLFTGYPGCGKSTLIERIIQKLNSPATGFFTQEIRKDDQRIGFSIDTLDGNHGLLASTGTRGQYRVGKYGVNIEDIDRIIVPSIIPKTENTVVIIDEIGKMECFSPLFRRTLIDILNSDYPVIGSVSLKGNQFIQKIKTRADVLLVHVNEKNRDRLVDMYSNYWRNKNNLMY